MRQSDTVYLLDASIYIFQAWFGYPDRFHDAEGRPVNAVYGYLKTLLAQLSHLQPCYMLAAFDQSLFTGFRHQLYPDYKANRALPDDSLARQLRLCQELTALAGLHCVGDSVYEADDWLALGAQTAARAGLPHVVITRDKDLAQLVGVGDCWWDWSGNIQRDAEGVRQAWLVEARQIPDLLALMGDSADNIPGVPGVGAKSARPLVQHFGNLENLYSNLDEVLTLPVRGVQRLYNVLQGTEEQALLYRELIRLHPPGQALPLTDLERSDPGPDPLLALLRQEGLGKPFVKLVTDHYA